MIYLKKLVINNHDIDIFPLNIDVFKKNKEIIFDNDVTIIVGENGSGKSTILEVIAASLRLNRISSDLSYEDADFIDINKSLKYFTPNITYKPGGFFFRAEDFFTYTRFLLSKKQEASVIIEEIDSVYKQKNASPYAISQAKSPHFRTISEINNMYAHDLLLLSHGESYLEFFNSRLKNNKIYLFDEVETPLSFVNQLALIAMIKEYRKESQFIIATHSPILMAIPNAKILEINEGILTSVSYDELDVVRDMKSFLNNREGYLRHL